MINLFAVRKDFREYLDTLGDLSDQKKAWIEGKLFDDGGCAWKFLVPLGAKGKALLIGAGWSNAFVFLAENFQEVLLWDPDPLRISILRQLAKLLELEVCFHNGDFDALLHSRHRFDLVILENSLAWLPSYLDGSPKQIQAAVLRKAAKLLNSQGQCFVLIPNRFAYERWKGETGDYAELPFITLLPRAMAGAYSRLVKKQAYRTYTYSLPGLRRLARQAGFCRQEIYFIYPSSENPRELLGWGNISPSCKSHPLVQFLNRAGIGKYFQSSLALVGANRPAQKSFIEQLLQQLQAQLGSTRPLGIDKCVVSKTNAVIFFLRGANTGGAVLRLPLDKISFERLQNGFNTIQYVKSMNEATIAGLLPEQLANDIYLGQPYFVERRMPGIEATALAKSPADLSRLVADTAAMISNFTHSSQKVVQADTPTRERYFLSYFRAVRPYLPDYRVLLDQIAGFLEQITAGQRLPLVLAHGDLKLSNLLINPASRRLTGILDWDMSELRGLPLLDILHLVLAKYRLSRSWSIGTAVTEILLPQGFEQTERRIIEDYKQRFGISEKLYRALMITYWAKHILRNLVESGGSKHPAWMKENIIDVFQYMKREMA